MPIADRNSATAPKLSERITGERRLTRDFSIRASIVWMSNTGSSRSICDSTPRTPLVSVTGSPAVFRANVKPRDVSCAIGK